MAFWVIPAVICRTFFIQTKPVMKLKVFPVEGEMEKLHPSTSTPKVERRVVEKNRRNHMKGLCTKLYALIPSSSTKEDVTVPDQIDAARIYIESLEKKLEMYKEKKEKLLHGKRPHSSSSISTDETPKKPKLTNVEIHDMGANMDAIFISGLEEQASFYGIIRLLCEEGFEVASANFSSSGNSVVQISYDKGEKSSAARADSAAVSKRLKDLIWGYSRGEVESRLDLWDFEIDPDLLSSEIFHQIMAWDVPSSISVAGV